MIELGNISKFRSELMGFAILIVMLFHVYVSPRSDWYGLARMGNLGVDIFFFLSGMGLWYSWSKNQSYRQFYTNRAIRIYPAWFIIAGSYFVSKYLESPKFGTLDGNINFLGEFFFNWNFWRYDELIFWYVPATMMMYLFAPFFMQAVRYDKACRWLLALPMMWCIIMQYVTPVHQLVGHIEIFWSRIPIFMLGICVADAVKGNMTLKKGVWGAILPMFALSLSSCMWLEQMRHGKFPLYVERMLYIVLAITTILIMTQVFLYLKQSRILGGRLSWINKAFVFLGGISLEVYLIHVEYVLKPLQREHLGYWPTFLLTFIISIPAAWVVSKVCSYIINKVKPLLK